MGHSKIHFPRVKWQNCVYGPPDSGVRHFFLRPGGFWYPVEHFSEPIFYRTTPFKNSNRPMHQWLNEPKWPGFDYPTFLSRLRVFQANFWFQKCFCVPGAWRRLLGASRMHLWLPLFFESKIRLGETFGRGNFLRVAISKFFVTCLSSFLIWQVIFVYFFWSVLTL